MATPLATGTCALILQAKPGLSPQQVKDLLMSTAKNLGLDGNTQGKGRADGFAAYQAALGQTPPPPPTPTPPPGQGQGCLEAVKNAILGK
jgi:serine protease AprX